MGPTTTPALPLPPLSGPVPEGLQTLQIQAESPVAAEPEAGGLFAVLLSQLTIEEPAPRPVAPVAGPAFLAPAPATTDQPLPQTGNLLPQFIEVTTRPADVVPPPMVVQIESAELTINGVTDQAQPLPLPALPSNAITPNPAPARVAATPAPVLALAKPAVEPAVAGSNATRDAASLPARATEVRAPAPVIASTITENNPAPPVQTQAQPATPQPGNAPATTDTIAPLLAAAPQPGQQPTGQVTQPIPQTYQLNHPVADARWGDTLGQRLVWMSENGVGRAEIRLNPPELGPVDVRVAVANDEARVAFNVQHGATREAIEAAMPRLRDLFAQQGIELTDASVSQHSPGEKRQAGNTDSDQSGTSSGQTNAGESPGEHEAVIPLGDSLIDTYV